MKKKANLVVLSLLLITFVSCSTKTYTGRWFLWNASEIDDYTHFPNFEFNSSTVPFRYIEVPNPDISDLMVTKKGESKKPLDDILKDTKTTAFLVIRQDTIIYEQYYNGYQRASLNTTFSVAKSVTGLLAGKAIDDGYLESKNEKITTYLPELKQSDIRFDQVELSFLLDMRSGIRFKDHDLIWGDKSKAYYDPYLRDRVEKLKIDSEPGSNFKYNSYNPIVVGMVLEEVTETSPANYFKTRLWDKMGMEFNGSWSMDSEEDAMTKMESGLNLRAIDFAKFGSLVLNYGEFNGEQIVSREWIEDCLKIDEGHKVPGYDDIYYKNFWWIYSSDGIEVDIISGWGHLGQYLYIFPEDQTIVVRMGKKNKGVESWGKIFIEVNDFVSGQ